MSSNNFVNITDDIDLNYIVDRTKKTKKITKFVFTFVRHNATMNIFFRISMFRNSKKIYLNFSIKEAKLKEELQHHSKSEFYNLFNKLYYMRNLTDGKVNEEKVLLTLSKYACFIKLFDRYPEFFKEFTQKYLMLL